ncbi:hypothetical protein, partial [Corynebacterium phoceense]
MGFLLGRKDRERTSKRRGEVAKKSASLLAAIAVAGGGAVVGMPAAEAVGPPAGRIYFEKISDSGEHLAGSEWEMVLDPEQERIIRESGIPYFNNAYKFRIMDNFNPRPDPSFDVDEDGYTYLPDLTPVWWTPDIQPGWVGKKGNLPPCLGTPNSSNVMLWPSMKT